MLDDTFLTCPQCLLSLPYNHFIHSGKLETCVKNRNGLCNLCTLINQNISKINSHLKIRENKLLILQNDLKLGIKKECIRCHRFIKSQNLNQNNICKRCISFFRLSEHERKLDLFFSQSSIERKQIELNNLKLSCFDKEEIQKDLDLKISQFLLNKEKQNAK